MDYLISIPQIMFIPTTSEHLVHAYLLWMGLFFVVNVTWDILTKKTPKFHLHRLKDKTTLAMGATSFCSSSLLLGSLLSEKTATVVGATPVPTLIAGTVGILLSITALCPYTEQQAAEPTT
ncbi:MAG: hypothetical protein JXQ89_09585 [Pelagimonas sp.]